MLDRLLDAVRAGESRVLVVRGEAGVGKTALLDYLVEQASGCRVARAAGVESEMELAFAGLHQLLTPMLDRLERLPAPQADALRTAFGLSSGSAPDRFLVGLAALSLLAEVAEEHPLVCLVDDAQWLDRASAQVLAFVARRLAAESVGLVFAARVPGDELAGLPELVVEGLREADARALLDSVLTGPLDARVRDRIVAEAGGNPLALLELPRGLAPAELAGGFALPARDAAVGADRGELPAAARGASGRQPDACCSWRRPSRSATRCWCGGRPSGSASAPRRRRRRPRPAWWSSAPGCGSGIRWCARRPTGRRRCQERQEVHRALAEATDPELDPDRRAWHRAQATPGPDEEVAAELERSAGRAQARGRPGRGGRVPAARGRADRRTRRGVLSGRWPRPQASVQAGFVRRGARAGGRGGGRSAG